MTKRKPSIMMRIAKGALKPADGFAAQALRDRGYHIDDVVAVEIRKPRNPGFHRLAHQIGSLVSENIEAFSGLNSHAVLKRIQLEANIACDEIPLNFPGIGPCSYRVPQSLSFESLDEAEFHEVVAAICAHIARQYWPSVSADAIEAMASAWVEPI